MKRICAVSVPVLLTLLTLCACNRQATSSATATPQPPPPPQILILTANLPDRTNDSASTTATGTNLIRWEVAVAEFPESAIEQHGLKNLLDKAPDTNAVISEEIARSHLVRMARADTNIVLTLGAGVCAGRCSVEAADNLITYFKQRAGVDLLTLPQAITSGTNQARLYVGNNITVFTGASSNASPVTPFLTNLSFGNTVTLRALSSNADKTQLEAIARFDEFGGYLTDDRNYLSQFTIGAPPIFNVGISGTRMELRTNEVLLLGSPTKMNVRKTIQRVPKLSEIPRIGRLFTKVRVETNFVRRLVIIIPHRQ